MVDLGSRRGGDYTAFAGGTRAIASRLREVQTTLKESKPARIVVNTAIGVAAATNPAIGALVVTYNLSRAFHKVASTAAKEYQATGDANAAARAAARQTVGVAIGVARGQVIGNLVDVGWSGIKQTSGISTDSLQDKILITAAKSTLNEVLPR